MLRGLTLRSRGHGSRLQDLGRNPAPPLLIKLPNLTTEASHFFPRRQNIFFHDDQTGQISALGKETGRGINPYFVL